MNRRAQTITAAHATTRDAEDDVRRLVMSHDASPLRMVPASVIRAESITNVAELLRQATASGTSVTFRSGGTSLNGQSLTNSRLVDVRTNFKDIQILDEGARVRAQPGATIRAVNGRLARFGRALGPDPASEIAATVGGVVANNSSGMTCGIIRNAYATIDSAVLCLPDGQVIDTARVDADAWLRMSAPRIYEGLLAIRESVLADEWAQAEIRRQFSIKNTMGYAINAFLDYDRAIDILLHLTVGSEGTLAFLGEVTLQSVVQRLHRHTSALVFECMEAAVSAVEALAGVGARAIELLDSTSLQLAQRDERCPAALAGLNVDGHALLLVELQEGTASALQAVIGEFTELVSGLPIQPSSEIGVEGPIGEAWWRVRKDLYAKVASAREAGTSAILEDVAVPLPRLTQVHADLTGLLASHGYGSSVIFGHAMDGNLHFMLAEDLSNPNGARRFESFSDDLAELILRNGGSLKAEHGTGRLMARFVRQQYGDSLFKVMRDVKSLIDPADVLSPGVMFESSAETAQFSFKEVPSVDTAVDDCVDCGYCEAGCPSAALTFTPRQRIAWRRERALAAAQGDRAKVAALEAVFDYAVVDTCAVDGLCGLACPVAIDTGAMVRDLRQIRATSPLDRVWSFASRHWSGVVRVITWFLYTARALPNPLVKEVNKALRDAIGDDVVPLLGDDIPRPGGIRRGLAAADPVAIFLPSCTGQMFGGGSAGAFLSLCGKAGLQVLIPDDIANLCCGTPWKSKGMTRGGELMAQRVLRTLASADLAALPIIMDSTSCTHGLREAIGRHLPAARIVDATQFVSEYVIGRLVIRRQLNSLVLHPTCASEHLRARASLVEIASAVAANVLVPDHAGCCGFAGDRGLLHPELTASATAREGAEVRAIVADGYASSNRTCEIGMTRSTGKPYRHILEYLDECSESGGKGG